MCLLSIPDNITLTVPKSLDMYVEQPETLECNSSNKIQESPQGSTKPSLHSEGLKYLTPQDRLKTLTSRNISPLFRARSYLEAVLNPHYIASLK